MLVDVLGLLGGKSAGCWPCIQVRDYTHQPFDGKLLTEEGIDAHRRRTPAFPAVQESRLVLHGFSSATCPTQSDRPSDAAPALRASGASCPHACRGRSAQCAWQNAFKTSRKRGDRHCGSPARRAQGPGLASTAGAQAYATQVARARQLLHRDPPNTVRRRDRQGESRSLGG